jgi:3-oxoacyl-ACP reductase-like protein
MATTAKARPVRKTRTTASTQAMKKTTAKTSAPAAVHRRAAPSKAAKPAAPAAEPVAATTPRAAKPPKLKLVRDSFTIPRDEYGVIDQLKLRAATLGRISKKSELLRAGLKALAQLADAALLRALEAVPSIKTGRPKAKRTPSTGT